MKPAKLPSPRDAHDEISALIETLHLTGQRLEELTAGEVDAVADRGGRTFLLRHAQEQLRDSEAAKQAAILNALPAHIALLDAGGTIVSVNQGWRTFASENALQGPHYAIGVNYLDICDSARGDDAAKARQAAAGIRSVMAGAAPGFSVEYPCHSPTQQRWFLMKVTPLADDHPNGVVVMHLDLTSEKLSEERYRLLFDSSIDAVLLTTPNGRILAANPSACRMFGRTREELLQGGRSLVVDTSDPRLAAALEQRSRTGQFTGELSLLRKDGATFSGEVSTSEFRDEGGQARTSMIVRDITERKKAEQKFRDLLEAAPDAMVIVDGAGEIALVNAAAINLFGWSREELRGQLTEMLMPERFRGKHHGNRGDYLTKPRARPMGSKPMPDLFGLRKDGTEFPVEISLSPLETDEGSLVISTIRDITERKQAMQEQRESERRFSDLLQNVGLISVMLDREARITYCNEYLLSLTGWRHEEVIGKDWFELFIPPESSDAKDVFGAVLANLPKAWHHENEILTRSGEHRLIRWNNSMLRSGSGDVIGTASIGEDITERKEAEAKIAFLNRVYAMLSGINTLIVRVRDRDELFREACRIAVDTGGFRMAMIAIVDQSTKKLVPIASVGKEEELLTAIKTILSSSEDAPKTMVARAIREKKAVVANDSQADPRVLFGKKYVESGVRSMAVLPLMVSDEAIGVIALYASETGFFREEEMKLLTELAGDIAFRRASR